MIVFLLIFLVVVVVFFNTHLGDGGGAFQIDSNQGVIRTLLSLDRETIPEYELTVVAADKGRPSMKSTVKVKITLEDVRDSKPKFEKDPYVVFLDEDVRMRSNVVTVKAVSQDLVQGGEIFYSIVSGNDPLTFVIQRNGVIMTKRLLDYETKPEYILKVRATSSPFFVETIVNVTLKDVNDNSPVLQDFFVVINVRDESSTTPPKFKIPAYDPDVSDRLTYEISEISQGDWDMSLNRTTGYLEVNPKVLVNTLVRPVQLKVRVSDGRNSLPANGKIFATLVTPQMLNNSFTLDVHDVTIKEFFDKSYEGLVRGIASAVNCEDYQVRLFNIESRIIKAKSPLEDDISNLKLWAAVYKNDRFSFYSPLYVRDMVYINMVQISKMAKVTLLPFKDGFCVNEICNLPTSRKSCLSHTDYTDKSNTYSSLKVVFRSVGVQTNYRCPCATDYRGESCDTGLNLCYSNPCGNNGKCVSVEEGYSCICNPGRAGVNCEIDMSKSKCPTDSKATENHLNANPCHSDGGCKNVLGSGFTCQCKDPSEVDGSLCQLTMHSFEKGSFVAFPGKDLFVVICTINPRISSSTLL